jgi:hypothetical protein
MLKTTASPIGRCFIAIARRHAARPQRDGGTASGAGRVDDVDCNDDGRRGGIAIGGRWRRSSGRRRHCRRRRGRGPWGEGAKARGVDQTTTIVALTIDLFDNDGGGETKPAVIVDGEMYRVVELRRGWCPDGNCLRLRLRIICRNAPTGCGPSFVAPSTDASDGAQSYVVLISRCAFPSTSRGQRLWRRDGCQRPSTWQSRR